VRRLAEAVGAAYGLAAAVRVPEGVPPVVNAPDPSRWAREGAARVLGADAVVPLGTTNMAGEDFACYLERIPGCFLRVGAREPGGAVIPAHQPGFYADEGAIFVGAAVLAEAARVAGEALREER
jgi:hippurate hydrolase